MNKFLKIVFISVGLLGLVSCAHNTSPAGVTNDNEAEQGSMVQTQGLGEQENLVGNDSGPTEGLLNKRSYYFAFDSNVVSQEDYPSVKTHATYLLKHPKARVLLEGNTDERGSREYNIGLGQRRANAVADILKSQGVSKRQIRTISYGAEKPYALGHDEEAYRVNRRVDLVYEAN